MSKIGAHVSIAGGIQNAPQRAAELGCEVLQLFTRSPRGGAAPKITKEIAESFKLEMKKWNQENCYIHTPYYINFASSNLTVRKTSIRIIREELERGSLIGAKYIMTHLGSSKDYPREEASSIVAKGVKEVVKGYKGTTQFLLEISAGAGNTIGNTFEELQYIIENSNKEVGVCIDSAHMFAGGYDVKSVPGIASTLKIIKKTVGLDKIKLIHANDSKVGLSEKKDRHDHIGDGKIGEAGFVNLMEAFPGVDFVLETEHDKVIEDIKILKRIRKSFE